LKNFISLFFLFTLTFVGDFDILGLNLFYILWLLLIIYRIIFNVKIQKNEIKTQLILTLIFSISIIREIFTFNYYANSYIQLILYVNIIPLYFLIINKKSNFLKYFSLIIQFIFIFIGLKNFRLMLSDGLNEYRAYILFGPNVLYRIYIFLFAITYINYKNNESNIVKASNLIFLVINLLLTGSRGALICLVLLFLFMLYNYKDFRITKKQFNIIIFSIIFIMIINFDFLQQYFWRLLYFNFDNSSNDGRVDFYSNTYQFLQKSSFLELLFGVGPNNNYFDFYPHNIMLETIVYNGLLLSIICLFCIIRLFKMILHLKIHYLLFFGIFIGSFLSGSLFENFPIFIYPVYNLISKTKI
jgi:hypothetical protein